MFRRDKLTVKREDKKLENNECVYAGEKTVHKDIPCHLSISLNNTSEINAAPYLISSFTLFLNYNPEILIKENDILYIETNKSQKYRLYAGEIKIYNLTTQIKCMQQKNIES